MTTPAARTASSREGALFTIAWYAVVLAVVFTTAFWVGRTAGPTVTPEPAPQAPHAHVEGR